MCYRFDSGKSWRCRVVSQILARDLKPETVKRLKARAKRHNRSLQGEVKTILEEAAALPALSMEAARTAARRIRASLAGRTFSDSADLIREDRER